MVIFSKDKSPANVNGGKGWTPNAIRRWLKYYGQNSDVLGCFIVPGASSTVTAARAAGVIGSNLLWSRAAPDGGTVTCRATAPVAFIARAAVGDGRPSFRIRAYSGGAMKPDGWDRTAIDLAGLAAVEPLPVLLDHSLSEIVGQSTEVSIDKSTVDIAGRITGDVTNTADAAGKVVQHAKAGFLWRASVGISVEAIEDVARGATIGVNGREFRGPLVIVRRGTLREVSFVSSGADSEAYAEVAANVAESALEARC